MAASLKKLAALRGQGVLSTRKLRIVSISLGKSAGGRCNLSFSSRRLWPGFKLSSDPVALVVGLQESGMRSPTSVETRAMGQAGEQVQKRYGACSSFELKAALIGAIQFIIAFTTRAVKSPRKCPASSIKMIPH